MDPKIINLYTSTLDEKFNNLYINDCDPTDIYKQKVLTSNNNNCIGINTKVSKQKSTLNY